jgi:group I intron endonuclease
MGIIYCIHNLTTNKKYIGQTVEKLQRRVLRHFRTINETKISRAIQKYSKYNFVYGIVEEVEDANLLDVREQYWIKFYDTVENGFNIKEGGKCARGFKQSQSSIEKRRQKLIGKSLSAEHKQKISKAHMGKVLSKETVDKMIAYRTGRNLTENCKEKISRSHSKNTYELTNKDGTTLIIKNLSKFCKENNLHQSAFVRIMNGERKYYKNWTIKKLDSGQEEEYNNGDKLKKSFSGFKFDGFNS